MKFIVAGIGTDVGKTLVSAILVQALQADYWKPVQTGADTDSDTETIRRLVSHPVTFFPEAIRLKKPFSPHYAAELEGLNPYEFTRPDLPSSNNLIIETAGGLLVPISSQQLYIDWIISWKLPVILVSRHYLGSINHTLLSIEVLKSRQIPIKGLVFNGTDSFGNETVIQQITHLPVIGRIQNESQINSEIIQKYAESFRIQLI